MKVSWYYPEYEEETQEDGTVLYFVRLAIGGRDDDGEFLICLDGPAEGEKSYLQGD